MNKRQTIETLLTWLPEALSGGGAHLEEWIGTGPGPKLLTYGPLWNPSFAQLQHLIERLNNEHTLLHHHLTGRYLKGETRRKTVTVIGGRVAGLNHHEEIRHATSTPTSGRIAFTKHKGTKHETCGIYTWPYWVNNTHVTAAIDWLEQQWQGEPFLPRELYDVAA